MEIMKYFYKKKGCTEKGKELYSNHIKGFRNEINILSIIVETR